MSVEAVEVPIADIRRDGGTQMRDRIDGVVVHDFVQSLIEGAVFPPVALHFDGTAYWLVDGFHRVAAAEQAGRETVRAIVTGGVTREDAVLAACGANAEHDKSGHPRSPATKRRAVESALRIFAGRGERDSDARVAETCRVSRRLVHAVRSETEANSPQLVHMHKLGGRAHEQGVIARNGKRYPPRMPAKEKHVTVEQPSPRADDGVEDEPTYRPTRKTEEHDLVRTLVRQGLTTADIQERTGLKAHFIHHARRQMPESRKNPLQGDIREAVGFADGIELSSSFDERWSEANDDERKQMIDALERCANLLRDTIRRLKKDVAATR